MLIKILILCFLTTPILLFSQDTLLYEKTQKIEEAKKFKNGQKFKVYVLKDSSILKVGDTLIIGKISGSTSTTSNDLGKNLTQKVYTSAISGTFSDNVRYGIHFLPEGWEGKMFVIQEISVRHEALSKKSKVDTYALAKTIGNNKDLYTLMIDYGINNGEIINPKGKMTKAQALVKLKEAKELLDLDLIKQSQYDSLKKELSPIIMKQ